MASSSELSLDCKPVHNYTTLLKSFAEQDDQTHKLEEFLSRLEDERLKIDAFKRELPLCMQLLTNAVEVSRQQLQAYRGTNMQVPKPVLEEFIPLKHTNSEGSEMITTNICDNKANWMISAQLWSQAGEENKTLTTITTSNMNETDISLNVSSKLGLDNKQRNGGAFIPFSKDRNSCPSPTLRSLPELALVSVDENSQDKSFSDHENENGVTCKRRPQNPNKIDQQGKENGNSGSQGQTNNHTNNTNGSGTTQTQRKARRCWSPDLHRRFVNALQLLGGSQVATPKQIRELMKVDGLTNDEVKSHLQKYRLHTRRPSPNPQVAGGPAPQLVVLGGIWVPPEYATAHTGAHTAALYSPTHPATISHAPPHYCGPSVPQDFYAVPPPPPPHQLHQHSIHQQLHVYKTAPHTPSSPKTDFRGVGIDCSESIEDGKSESSSWKGESVENGERKGLGALREDGEESNGSDITLKF